ncbi:TPA: hypothetical protein ACJI3N_005359 [Raoultella planticola]
MGLSINTLNLKRVRDRLTNSEKAFKRYLLQDMTRLAKKLERFARAMAPFETGSLEHAIYARVKNDNSANLSIELSVSGATPRKGYPNVTVGDYAQYMIDQYYGLGPGSIRKQETSSVDGIRVQVGRRYLERAVERIRKEFPSVIQNAARKAGFTRKR